MPGSGSSSSSSSSRVMASMAQPRSATETVTDADEMVSQFFTASSADSDLGGFKGDHDHDDDDDDDDMGMPTEGFPATQVVEDTDAAMSTDEDASDRKESRVGAADTKQHQASPNGAGTPVESLSSPDEPENTRAFTTTFGKLWQAMEAIGWQTAQGPDTLIVSMPGTAFFNFKPNINVFDSKAKAVWKWIALSASPWSKTVVDAPDDVIWETLWPIAKNKFDWFTMSSGDETWYVQPATRFEEFQPNVTIFQSKKLAVLKCLANENMRIKLGDSVEGVQVIDFAEMQRPAKTASAKAKKVDAYTTPPTKKKVASSASAGSDKKRKTTPSSGKKSSGSSSKSSASKGSGSKSAKTASKSAVKSLATPSPVSKTPPKKKEPPLVFHVPEFKCTFGRVYEQLQERGWTHQPGRFEYDYFSPHYTKETAILNGNYFQSVAEFEAYLKDSGLWSEIEQELRDEHAEMVEELREEARRKRDALRAKQIARASADRKRNGRNLLDKPKNTEPTKPSDPSTDSGAGKNAASSKRRRSSFTASLPSVKITIGNVVRKLTQRGWYYKPGRFEYDYFKPGVTISSGKLNEDYFQSEAELETYLKVSGIWNEVAREIEDEFFAEQEREAAEMSQEYAAREAASAKKARKISDAEDRETKENDTLAPAKEKEVAVLTNDIWSNAHQFQFDKY